MQESKNYSFFSHRSCEYFPCHSGADEENFNCLFCYCPLYALGGNCGGSFKYTADGIKDCSDCVFPHLKENYESVNARFAEIAELIKNK